MSGVAATAAVAKRLRSVVGSTANVFDMLGNPTTDAAFKARYVNVDKVHSYEVTREGSLADEGGSSQAITRNEQIVIYGYYGWKDGVSEPVFQAEVDAICAAFDPPRLRQFEPANEIEWSAAPRVEGPRMGKLGQVLVHYVRITITVSFDPIF